MRQWKYFGTDGIRGKVGENFNFDLISRIAKATATYLTSTGGSHTLIGCDTRESCGFIVNIISGTLAGYGIDVTNIGIVPTAALSYLTNKLHCDLGIMVSASHNDYTYNGVKFFTSSGRKLDDKTTNKIDKLIAKNKFAQASTNLGKITKAPKAIKLWEKFLVNYFQNSFRDTSYPFSLQFDCAFGSGTSVAQKVTQALGIEATFHNTVYTGKNINEHCGATQPAYMSAAMQRTERKAQTNHSLLGFAFDGDADRCVVFDGQGSQIHGDILICLLAKHLKVDTVVSTVLFNYGAEKYLKNNGIKLIRTEVGDRHIYNTLEKYKLHFGGEECGHVIFPDIWQTGDGLLTALMVLQMCKQLRISELVKDIKLSPQSSANIPVTSEQKKQFLDSLSNSALRALYTAFPDYNIVVRASGTEKLIRIVVQGETAEKCDLIKNDICNLLTGKLRK